MDNPYVYSIFYMCSYSTLKIGVIQNGCENLKNKGLDKGQQIVYFKIYFNPSGILMLNPLPSILKPIYRLEIKDRAF